MLAIRTHRTCDKSPHIKSRRIPCQEKPERSRIKPDDDCSAHLSASKRP